jgi:hypothetical protein
VVSGSAEHRAHQRFIERPLPPRLNLQHYPLTQPFPSYPPPRRLVKLQKGTEERLLYVYEIASCGLAPFKGASARAGLQDGCRAKSDLPSGVEEGHLLLMWAILIPLKGLHHPIFCRFFRVRRFAMLLGATLYPSRSPGSGPRANHVKRSLERPHATRRALVRNDKTPSRTGVPTKP